MSSAQSKQSKRLLVERRQVLSIPLQLPFSVAPRGNRARPKIRVAQVWQKETQRLAGRLYEARNRNKILRLPSGNGWSLGDTVGVASASYMRCLLAVYKIMSCVCYCCLTPYILQ